MLAITESGPAIWATDRPVVPTTTIVKANADTALSYWTTAGEVLYSEVTLHPNDPFLSTVRGWAAEPPKHHR